MRQTHLRRRLQSALVLALLSPACGGETLGPLLDDAGDGSTQPDDASQPDTAVPDVFAPEVVNGDAGQPDVDIPDVTNAPDTSCHPEVPLPKGSPPCTQYAWPLCGYDGHPLSTAECKAICPEQDAGFSSSPNYCIAEKVSGVRVIQCDYCIATGRRVEGLEGAPDVGETAASFFAHCAWLEAASMHAFRRLTRELTAHGAPARLVARSRRAAREEVRHTAITRRIARRYGGEIELPRVPRGSVRALAAIARENAVEGCVRETYGALVAMWQAEKAKDPEVRRALESIAHDEAGHAELAWETMEWLEPRLSPLEQRRVEAARRSAIEELRRELRQEPSEELVKVAGLPNARQALRLLDAAIEQRVFGDLRRAA
jgi:hypothetical protein